MVVSELTFLFSPKTYLINSFKFVTPLINFKYLKNTPTNKQSSIHPLLCSPSLQQSLQATNGSRQCKITITAQINIVICVAYNSMGISVSNSDANNQVNMVREYKKQKRLEMIGSQVNRVTLDPFNVAALRQNYRYSKSANVSPQRNETRNGTQKQQNGNNISSERQKKVPINSSKTIYKGTKYTSNDTKGAGSHKNMHRQRFAEIQQETTNAAEKVRNSSKAIENNQLDQTLVREAQPIEIKRSQNNKSWRGPLPKQSQPAQPPALHQDIDSEMRRLSFEQFDWHIPGEQQQKEIFRRKAHLPSMNLVLSNKFAQNTNYISDQAQRLAAKSRRQVMRQLLTGKRNTSDDDFKFLPRCNFQRVEVPNLCQNR